MNSYCPRSLRAFRNSAWAAWYPIEVTDLLAAVDSLNAERNQVIVNEMHTVCKLLNGGGIEPVLLKGAAYLAAGVYRNHAARYLGDIDLLIPAAQIQSASNLLGRNGYRQDESDQFAGFRHHHPPLRRPGSVFIELHHSVGMGPCASLLPADEIFLESGAYDLGGVQVKLPAPNQLAIHLIAHSQIQHSYNERIWPPLRAMYDLALLQGTLRGRTRLERNWDAFSKGKAVRSVSSACVSAARDAWG